jgi:Holliday junction resolvase RusA-like endonuclease
LYPTARRSGGGGPRRPAHERGKGLGILPSYRDGDPTSWEIIIPGWTPPSLNSLLYRHWSVARKTKQKAMDQVAACCLEAGVTRAIGKRRVAITVTVGQLSHRQDADNVSKAILDGLKHAGALVDDGPDWCDQTTPCVVLGDHRGTKIRIEDIKDQ